MSVVHFLVAMSMYGLHGLVVERRLRYGLLFLAGLGMMTLERFYLFPPFAFITITHFLFARNITLWKRLVFGIGIVVAATVFYKVLGQIYNFNFFMTELETARTRYNAYKDVDPRYNLDINYFLALFKITFTPFFTLNKFSLFSDFSYILIWSVLVNQLVIMGAFIGGWISFMREWRRHWFNWLPFLYFLLLFAYLAPYSGRQRDSFYPMLVMYFAYALSTLLTRRVPFVAR